MHILPFCTLAGDANQIKHLYNPYFLQWDARRLSVYASSSSWDGSSTMLHFTSWGGSCTSITTSLLCSSTACSQVSDSRPHAFERTQICAARVFFLPLFSCYFNDRWSPTDRFVILCICWDTPSENSVWQLPNVFSAFEDYSSVGLSINLTSLLL